MCIYLKLESGMFLLAGPFHRGRHITSNAFCSGQMEQIFHILHIVIFTN